MRDVVRAAFVDLTIGFEGGYIGWMFCDIEGKVSTGFGLLLEPVAIAIGLPWRRADGSLASREEIVQAFPNAARLGHRSVEHVAKLRLDNVGLYQAFQGKLGQHDVYLRHRFPDFESWPSDAQLGAHSMAWACGAGAWDAGNPVGFPRMAAALERGDFLGASEQSHMNEWDNGVHNPGLVPRNKANRVLFRNASSATDPAVLYYPRDLALEFVDPAPDRPLLDGGPVYAIPDPARPDEDT